MSTTHAEMRGGHAVKLNSRNYYSPKANAEYFSVSQFKDFMKCPAMAMAKLSGEYEEEYGRALLL